jgi:gliding motility-associated-like protein
MKVEFTEPSQIQETATVVDPVITNEEVPTTNVSPEKQTPSIPSNTTELSGQIAQEVQEAEQLKQLPNVFTPNNDGSNDLFEIKSEGLTDFQLVILNESNKVIFNSSDASFSWDGTLSSGDPAPAGTYLYYLTAKDEKQHVISRSSLLKLIR